MDEVKGMMADNIELLLERGQKLEEMDEKASNCHLLTMIYCTCHLLWYTYLDMPAMTCLLRYAVTMVYSL